MDGGDPPHTQSRASVIEYAVSMGPLPSYCVLVEVPKASRLKWTSDCKLFAAPLYEAV